MSQKKHTIENINTAISALKAGKGIIIVDHPDRENEGDFMIPAEKITAEILTFMAKKASGLICLAITQEKANALNLPLQQHGKHRPVFNTAFTYSVEAREGVTSGISAADRVHTIQTIIKKNATPEDIAIPGHIFPLIAETGGVLTRPGHTEAAVSLAMYAGYTPAAVIVEIMGNNGEMLKGKALKAFAEQHDCPIVSIAELITYEKLQKNTPTTHPTKNTKNLLPTLKIEATAKLETEAGSFIMAGFTFQKEEYFALFTRMPAQDASATLRIHSACLTGDVFGSKHCDCGQQLTNSLEALQKADLGICLYLPQEGRGIGLLNKIKAYHLQQTQGLDTVDANLALGLPVDKRDYTPVIALLQHFGLSNIQLLTNNPQKLSALTKAGFNVQRSPLSSDPTQTNQYYLKTKKNKCGHFLEIPEVLQNA